MSNQPRIQTDNQYPGIQNGLAYSPHMGGPLTRLVETVLRRNDDVSRGEREFAMAAACQAVDGNGFCYRLHSQCADLLFFNQSPSRLHDIDALAKSVVGSKTEDSSTVDTCIENCRAHGFTEREIHDIMLIASVAVMVTAYTNAVNAPYPDDVDFFRKLAIHFVQNGYLSAAEQKRA